jgi:signal peptidase II
MADPLRENPGMKSHIWGPLSPLGLALALLVFGVDQAHKWWMLNIYDIGARGPVAFTPFLDLLLVWNKGISYGLFNNNGQGILVVVMLFVCAVLWIWLCRSHRPVTVAALGLVIGGALGNALDRLTRGAVADFFQLHWGDWTWYVFNLADVAIVAGVALLLYESFRERNGAAGLGNA